MDMNDMPRRSQALRFNRPWVRVAELLDVFNEHTKSCWGVHEIVALMKQDNKQRFVIAGSEDDPRSSYYNQPVFPLLDDKDIAVHWLTLVSSAAGPL